MKPGRMDASASPSRRSRRTQNEWKVEISGGARRFMSFEQRSHARAHFAGGFIREGDGQNGRRRHVIRADQMRDAMRDDARLAAARAGQDQHRAFGRCYCFTLLGIETGEKIHY